MLAWGRRGINLNASVWHLNVSRELLLDSRDIHDVEPPAAFGRRKRRETKKEKRERETQEKAESEIAPDFLYAARSNSRRRDA